MPRKFSINDKDRWLEEYEAGRAQSSIANESNCDIRTVKRGIEEARRGRDAQAARVDILKQAVSKHQERLMDRLGGILSDLTVPPHDWAVLSWCGTRESILSENNLNREDSRRNEASEGLQGSDAHVDIVEAMLKQHLKNDKLWRALARREKAYASHRLARIALQRKVVNLLEEETGYRLEAGSNIPPPFIYSYTTGDLFYRRAIAQAFGDYENDAWQDEIIVDPGGCRIEYRNLTLAEVPGAASDCRENLLKAFRKIQVVTEATRVANTYEELEESTFKAKEVIQEIELLGLVPGVCKVCRRLGM